MMQLMHLQLNITNSHDNKDGQSVSGLMVFSVLRPKRPDRKDRGLRGLINIHMTIYLITISRHPVIVERRNTAYWIRHDETRRMVVITYF